MKAPILIKATKEHAVAVADIYDSVRKKKYCPWDEDYPTMDNIKEDIQYNGLYVLTLEQKVIGCVSVEHNNNADGFNHWKICDGTHREISRIAISPSHQGNGYAELMLTLLFDKFKKSEVRSIHLLVASTNPPAMHTYKKLGFDFLSLVKAWGQDYFLCEKLI